MGSTRDSDGTRETTGQTANTCESAGWPEATGYWFCLINFLTNFTVCLWLRFSRFKLVCFSASNSLRAFLAIRADLSSAAFCGAISLLYRAVLIPLITKISRIAAAIAKIVFLTFEIVFLVWLLCRFGWVT